MARTVLAFFWLIAAAVAGGVAADSSEVTYYTFADVVGPNPIVPSDPGSAPPFESAPYDAFRAQGAGSIVGSPFVTLAKGVRIACRPGLGANLYPDTPYVRWMLAKWGRHLATTGDWEEPADFTRSPSLLNAYARVSVVRYAECSQAGSFDARDLPVGPYIVIARLLNVVAIPKSGFDQVQVQDPSGDFHIEYRASAAAGGYIAGYGADGFFEVALCDAAATGRQCVLDAADWKTIGHASLDAAETMAKLKRMRFIKAP